MFNIVWDKLAEDLGNRGAGAAAGFLVGSVGTWLLTRWRRRREKQSVRTGDARDTVVIHLHLVERDGDGKPAVLRVRTVGMAELSRVVPNGHLAGVLRRRARAATARDTLISMDGPEGSYLLETLTDFVCDRLASGPFPHDRYVMAPCCEPKELAHYQPMTVILIAVSDLDLFADWPRCRGVRVEHGSDGARVLTLHAMAQRFRAEQERLVKLRAEGVRTQYAETMYVLDLAVDRKAVPLESKAIPWHRFERPLKDRGLA